MLSRGCPTLALHPAAQACPSLGGVCATPPLTPARRPPKRPLQDSAAERRARRTRTLNAAHAARVQRGLIRYLQVVVDLSRAAAATDMRPLRAAVMAGCLARFIRAFFDENPLSQLGLVAMREGTACVLSPLASSPVGCVRGDLGVGGGSRARRARCHMHRQAGRVGDPRRHVSPPPPNTRRSSCRRRTSPG